MAYKDSGGSRGAGGPGSLSFVDPVEVGRAENKKILKPPPPHHRVGTPPPPPPLYEGLDPQLKDYVLLPE